MKDNKDSLYTIYKAIEDIKYAFEELEFAENKYDYNKLPIFLFYEVVRQNKKGIITTYD